MTEATNPGNNANYYGTPYPIDSPYYTTVWGEFELSDSPYGTFDQAGNAREWNEAVINERRGIRGGSVYNYDDSLHASARPQSHSFPSLEDYFGHFGFRVSQVPEPTTLPLLALGGLAVMRRKRR